jgi:hypothetical protein
MKRIVVNGVLRSKLAKITKTVDLCDDKGRKLGTFTPEPIVPWDPSITQKELDRRARQPGGKTLAEIMKNLGAK